MKADLPRRGGAPSKLCLLGVILLAVPGCGGGKGGDGPVQGRPRNDENAGAIRLDRARLDAAGIKSVVAGPGRIEQTLRLLARVTSNLDTVVHVNPRVEGIVQAIHKGLGDEVKTGEPLAELWSVELGNTVSSHLKAHAGVLAAKETLVKTTELFKARLATAEKVAEGEIAVARKIYEREKELQEKSISTIRPYLEADKELQKAILAKERELTTLRAERDTRLLELDVVLRQARIEEKASRDRLLVLGFSQDEVEKYHGSHGKYGRIVLRAPRDGVVLDRKITLNEHVSTDRTLFEIHDLSTVWVLASAYEKDLSKIHTGQTAFLRLDALPGLEVEGKVDKIDYRISEATRTASVRIELPNEKIESWSEPFPLRPGMFGTVELVFGSRSARVLLPEKAIVHEGKASFVFVQTEAEGVFRRRRVETRTGNGGTVEIVDGIASGEHVVVDGTFVLKSLARAGELGEGDGNERP